MRGVRPAPGRGSGPGGAGGAAAGAGRGGAGGVAGRLAARGGTTRRLAASHAFRSRLMDPVPGRFAEVLAQVDYHPPAIPIAAGVTGELAAGRELCDPGYWAAQVRQPVR